MLNARHLHLKMSGKTKPIPWQFTLRSGVEPTPELPVIAIWLSVMDVIRRGQAPFILQYDLPPGITQADHGVQMKKSLFLDLKKDEY